MELFLQGGQSKEFFYMEEKIENTEARPDILKRLLEKGVQVPCPESVEIGVNVSPERISGEGVIIHTGCKIMGSSTLIMPGVELGYEAPATVHNCQIGRDVKLGGGFYHESVFLEGAGTGSGAQIREACLFEEGSRSAHNVGLKHTILHPFVTLGSLINFCDCMMAGGTAEKNHSEVGSSYIHFNFTPNQDKATPSIMGDVPRGVMLNQPPIFLGGQGGMAGPVRIEYGTVVAAGTIVRKDFLKQSMILLGHPSIAKSIPHHAGLYSNINRIIKLNIAYISNLITLRRWYIDIRSRFMERDNMGPALHKGAVEKIEMAIDERLKRLGEVADRMPDSIMIYKKIAGSACSEKTINIKQELFGRWNDIEHTLKACLSKEGDASRREMFLEMIENTVKREGGDYIRAIKGLNERESETGTAWLQGLVDEIIQEAWAVLSGYGEKND